MNKHKLTIGAFVLKNSLNFEAFGEKAKDSLTSQQDVN